MSDEIGKKVIVEIRDMITGKFKKFDSFIYPEPGKVTIWDVELDFILSKDISIRIDWPIEG